MNDAFSARGPLLPLLVLALFGAVLPAALPGASGANDEQCVTLADAPSHRPLDTLPLLERCSRLYADDAELAGDLAAAYEAAGDAARAEATYRRALTIDPGYAELRLRLGHLLLKKGMALDAAHQAELALRIQPNRRALVDLLQSASVAASGAAE